MKIYTIGRENDPDVYDDKLVTDFDIAKGFIVVTVGKTMVTYVIANVVKIKGALGSLK